jgi:hypothetical protein
MLVIWYMVRHVYQKLKKVNLQNELWKMIRDNPFLILTISFFTGILGWLILSLFHKVKLNVSSNKSLSFEDENLETKDECSEKLSNIKSSKTNVEELNSNEMIDSHLKEAKAKQQDKETHFRSVDDDDVFELDNDSSEDLWHRFQRVQFARKTSVERDIFMEDWDEIDMDSFTPPTSLKPITSNEMIGKNGKILQKNINVMISPGYNTKENKITYDPKESKSKEEELRKPSKENSLMIHKKSEPFQKVSIDKENLSRQRQLNNIPKENWKNKPIKNDRFSIENQILSDLSGMNMIPDEGIEEDFDLEPNQILRVTQRIHDTKMEEEIIHELDMIAPLSGVESMMLTDTIKDGFSEDLSGVYSISSTNTSIIYSEDETYDDLQIPEGGELKLKLQKPVMDEESLETTDIFDDMDINGENFETCLLEKMNSIQTIQSNPFPRNIGNYLLNNMNTTERIDINDTTHVKYSKMPRFLENLKDRNLEVVQEEEIRQLGIDIPTSIEFQPSFLKEFGDGTELDHLEDLPENSFESEKIERKQYESQVKSISRKNSLQVTLNHQTPVSPSKIPVHRNSNLRSKSCKI